MSGSATQTNVRSTRHSASVRAAIAAGLAVVLAIVVSLVAAPFSASADDYPTWDEVQNARANQANAEAEVTRVQGLIVSDWARRIPDAIADLAHWHTEGRIVMREDVRGGGLDAYVETLNLLYTSGNNGKLVLDVRD